MNHENKPQINNYNSEVKKFRMEDGRELTEHELLQLVFRKSRHDPTTFVVRHRTDPKSLKEAEANFAEAKRLLEEENNSGTDTGSE